MIQSSTKIVETSDDESYLKLPSKSIVSDNKKQSHTGDLNLSMDPSISQSSTDIEVNHHAKKDELFIIPRKKKLNNQTSSMKTKPRNDNRFVTNKSSNNQENDYYNYVDSSQSYYNEKSGNNYQVEGQNQNYNSQRYAKSGKKTELNHYYTNQNIH